MQHHRIFVTFAILAVMIGLAQQSHAGEYCWTNARGDGDWTKPGNFVVGSSTSGEVATVAPGTDDEVYVRGTTVTLEYDTNDDAKKASCEAFAAVKQIHPTDTNDSKFGEGRAPSRPPRGWIVSRRGAESAEVAN